MIVVNAHTVNQGELPVLKEIDKPEKPTFNSSRKRIGEDPPNILDLCSERSQAIQVSSTEGDPGPDTMHKGTIGCHQSQHRVAEETEPRSSGITRGAWTFRVRGQGDADR